MRIQASVTQNYDLVLLLQQDGAAPAMAGLSTAGVTPGAFTVSTVRETPKAATASAARMDSTRVARD